MENLYKDFKYKNDFEVEERIDKNNRFMKDLEKLIVSQETELDKLRLIEWIGFLYSEYVTGQYASKELEQEIIAIGNKMVMPLQKQQPKKNHILIVMTASGAVGGHSVLVNNWMRWDTKNKYSVVFTEQGYDEVVDFIKESVRISGGNIFCLSGDYFLKARELFDVSQDFEKILLFTHMYDVVPVLVYGNKNWKIPILFYNHADFRFSFGISVADKVLNLCPYDRDKTEQLRGVSKEKNVILRFPNGGQIVNYEKKMEEAKNRNEKKKQKYLLAKKFGFDENEKLIVSAAGDFKYQNILNYSFTWFVETLLGRYNGKASFLIIGADKESPKWKKLYKRTGGKGRAMGELPRQDMDALIEASDLYVVSFPMLGSGGMVAEKAQVPYLALFITERGKDCYADNAAHTVDELTEKALDVLNGNGGKYLGHMSENYETQEEWQSKWEKTLASTREHILMEICPKRCVEVREYVNCQLMQDVASDHAARYLFYQEINEQLREQIFYLDNKYGMNIFHKMEVFEKEMEISRRSWEATSYRRYSDKHLALYLLAIKWVTLKQAGKSIEDYLLDKGCRSIAIYGMSYMGEAIYHELQGSDIVVLYGIDQKADQICTNLKVYHPCEAEKIVDLIINSTTLKNQIISEGIKKLQNIPMLSIEEILDAMNAK